MNKALYIPLITIICYSTTFSGGEKRPATKQFVMKFRKPIPKRDQDCFNPLIDIGKLNRKYLGKYLNQKYKDNKNRVAFIAKVIQSKTNKERHFLFVDNGDAKELERYMQENNGEEIKWYYVKETSFWF